MEDVVLLEWRFTPAKYFEDDICIERDNYKMVIKEGKVEAHINPSAYDKEHKMRDYLHQSLNDRFLGAQLVTHKPYELSKASVHRLHPDGRKDGTMFAETGMSFVVSATLDSVVKDNEGNIISDSRRDRINKKKELSELAEEYSSNDSVAASLLKSNNAAVKDPENELVHLYEIRDALSKRFSGEVQARNTLNLNASDWSRLGQLANSEPLKQGRHRGQSAGSLRDATEDELKEARNIALGFVEAYLVYLDANS